MVVEAEQASSNLMGSGYGWRSRAFGMSLVATDKPEHEGIARYGRYFTGAAHW